MFKPETIKIRKVNRVHTPKGDARFNDYKFHRAQARAAKEQAREAA